MVAPSIGRHEYVMIAGGELSDRWYSERGPNHSHVTRVNNGALVTKGNNGSVSVVIAGSVHLIAPRSTNIRSFT